MATKTSFSSHSSLSNRGISAGVFRRFGPLTALACLSITSAAQAEESSPEATAAQPEAPHFEEEASAEPASTLDAEERPAEPEAEPAHTSAPEGESLAPVPLVNDSAKNTIYLELFGPGLLYSFNYERRIQDFNLRVGFGGASWGGAGYFVVPFGATYTGIGVRQHRLELGATGTFIFADNSFSRASTFAFQPIIGYRRESRDGGFSFRAGLSPWISGSGVLPWGYVSFGITF